MSTKLAHLDHIIVASSLREHEYALRDCFKMEELVTLLNDQLLIIQFKIVEPNVSIDIKINILSKIAERKILFQLTTRQHLKFLSEKNHFDIWDNSNDASVAGLLVFKTFMDAYTFCREAVKYTYLMFTPFWYESCSGEIATQLLQDMTVALNDDCMEAIANRLDVLGFADLLAVNRSDRLIRIARLRFSELIINPSTVGNRFGLMNMCYILHVLGDIVTNITVSLHSFRGGSRHDGIRRIKHCILFSISNFAGSNLRSLTLQHFGIVNDDRHFRQIMTIFEQKIVQINLE